MNMIVSADKGCATEVIDRRVYDTKPTNMLSDPSTYEHVANHTQPHCSDVWIPFSCPSLLKKARSVAKAFGEVKFLAGDFCEELPAMQPCWWANT